MPRLRRRVAVPALQHLAHVPARGRALLLPLLRARGADAVHLPRVRQSGARRCAGWAPSSSSGCWPSGIPSARIARMDSTRRAPSGRTSGSSTAFGGGEVDILLGTQMIAKGLDFPERDAGRRGRRRHGTPPAGLPRGRADVPAPGAGGGARGPRAEGRARADPDAQPDAPRGALRRDARLPRRSSSEELALPADPAYPPAVALANVIVSGPDERR